MPSGWQRPKLSERVVQPNRCPECGRKLNGLMATNEDAPGLIETLTDDAVDAWLRRRALVVAIGLLIILLVLCGEAVLR